MLYLIGTDGGGLNKFEADKEIFTTLRHDPEDSTSLSHDRVWSIIKSRSGFFWIATFGGGLNKYDPLTDEFYHYLANPDDPTWLGTNHIMTLHEDQHGILWIGSNGNGLIKFNPQTEIFTSYAEDAGLPGSAVYGILEDENGCLWMSTDNGLSKFEVHTETFKNFDINDGLQSNEFNGGARFKNLKGEMFFGGINGFNYFSPDKIIDNPRMPER